MKTGYLSMKVNPDGWAIHLRYDPKVVKPAEKFGNLQFLAAWSVSEECVLQPLPAEALPEGEERVAGLAWGSLKDYGAHVQ